MSGIVKLTPGCDIQFKITVHEYYTNDYCEKGEWCRSLEYTSESPITIGNISENSNWYIETGLFHKSAYYGNPPKVQDSYYGGGVGGSYGQISIGSGKVHLIGEGWPDIEQPEFNLLSIDYYADVIDTGTEDGVAYIAIPQSASKSECDGLYVERSYSIATGTYVEDSLSSTEDSSSSSIPNPDIICRSVRQSNIKGSIPIDVYPKGMYIDTTHSGNIPANSNVGKINFNGITYYYPLITTVK